MFKKWGHNGGVPPSYPVGNEDSGNLPKKTTPHHTNTLLKGSKLIGDINVTYDLELGGEIQGNIRSEKDSNIVIKGICNGNVETKEGSVTIEGELRQGNIHAGKDVTISGKFNGGEINAKNRIQINGEFHGRIVADEIEIGPHASGKGELLYREFVSIAKGAKIVAQVNQSQKELKLVKPAPVKKIDDLNLPVKDITEVN